MSLALYRRYRPDTFSEVIGQEHVTGPLGQALTSGRIHHAFLFSGPRGCGKTTSARIMARALNCEQGPTPTPCGTCASCVDLATGGPGSLDVIEIDAASHGGVDDARDLRERAFYAPVQSRYKIYIIDEAHMVSREGFNALLKLVEEPPDYLRFIFATTEPEKVIATIRSRTHHYAFRLVAPRVLTEHLGRICDAEGVTVDEGVLPMVVRAGQGSVRDALSVLDQLVAGAEGSTVTAAYASSLLGYTDAALLDDMVDAFASRRGDAVFETLDRALDAGLDPRRFVSDLLERFRDLLILAVSGADATEMQALVPRPPDERDRMTEQAKRFGPAELTRNAELLSAGLTEMRGATAPRLTLELIAARMLLPTVDDTERQLQVRLEQVERQVKQGGVAAPAPSAPAPSVAARPAPTVPPPTTPEAMTSGATTPEAPTSEAPVSESADVPQDRGSQASDASARPTPTSADEPVSVVPSVAPTVPGGPAASTGGTTIDDVRRMWPAILRNVSGRRKVAWILLNKPGAGPLSLSEGRLAIGLPGAGDVKGFLGSGNDAVLKLALQDELGLEVEVDVVAQPAPTAGGSAPSGGASAADAPAVPGRAAPPAAPEAAPSDAADPGGRSAPTGAERVAAAKAQARDTAEDDEASIDLHSESADDAVSGEELLARMLDAKQIGEIQH
jgi:DNA polymerase-3 subunit gamma/tau